MRVFTSHSRTISGNTAIKIKGIEGRVKEVWLCGGAVLECCLRHSGVKAECPRKKSKRPLKSEKYHTKNIMSLKSEKYHTKNIMFSFH